MVSKNSDDKLFLLLDDDYIGWYLHGVFDDTQAHWHVINRITCQVNGYKVIRGNIIKEFLGEDF